VANYQSSSPRPTDGRVTVLAYALGEESFLDVNGNNVFDAGEDYQDLGDIFIDRLFNGSYNPPKTSSSACPTRAVRPVARPRRTCCAWT
jgi:hypothetical protein